MARTMTYKGYEARVEYSEEDGCFVGHLAGIRDIVGFDGQTADELRVRFRQAVDDYLAACAHLGQAPNEPALNARFLQRAERGRSKAERGSALLRKAQGG